MLVGLSQRTHDEARYAERRDCLDQEWARLLGRLGCLAAPLPNFAPAIPALLDRLVPDALILTGGSDPLPGAADTSGRTAAEDAMLGWAKARGIPVVAICRGLQAINVGLGGSVEVVSGHVAKDHRVIASDGTLLVVNSFHEFAIPQNGLAAELEPLMLADDGTVEAVRHRGLPWTGLMWHPERANASFEVQEPILKAALSGLPILPALRG